MVNVFLSTSNTMSTFMTEFSAFFAGMLTNVGAVITVVTGEPILLFGILVGLSGAVIGIFRRIKG